ncbi:MAG: hypothetical protein GC154_06080 [bacterium]|nr:hypothetical protein [bacterium]
MKSKPLQIAIAVVLGVIGLAVFYNSVEHWDQVWADIKGAHLGWLALAIAFNLFTIVIRAWRWRSFLGEPWVSPVQLFHISNVGFMGNGIFPARMGELIRPFLVGRMTPHRFSSALATIVVERFFDLLIILLLLAYSLWAFPFETAAHAAAPTGVMLTAADVAPVETPNDPRAYVQSLAELGMAAFGVLLTCVAVMSYAPKWSEKILRTLGKPLPEPILDKLAHLIHSFEKGSSTFRRPASFMYCLVLSVFLWMVITWGEIFVLWAFGVNDISFTGALFLMTVLCFTVMFPQLPGYIGPYQLAVAAVLTNLFGVSSSTSGAIAITMWMTQVPPIILMGFVSLVTLGVSFHDISHVSETAESEAA